MAWGTETWSSGSWSDGFPITVAVSGVEATGSPGSVTVIGAANIAVSGVEATGQVGTAIATLAFIATGVEATGAIGNVSIIGNAIVLTLGNDASGEVGVAAATKDIEVFITGIGASGYAGSVTIPKWINIIPLQDAGYIEINPTQSGNWSEGSIGN